MVKYTLERQDYEFFFVGSRSESRLGTEGKPRELESNSVPGSVMAGQSGDAEPAEELSVSKSVEGWSIGVEGTENRVEVSANSLRNASSSRSNL